MEVRLRKGEVTDLPAALKLIHELAEYEKMPGKVEVSIDEMQRWGFGSEKFYDFFVIEKAEVIIGIALYYFKYSTWKGKCLYLEDLIVTDSERCKGYGSMLFHEVLNVAKELKVKRVEWQVLNWNTPAIEFYKKFKASLDAEWLNGRLNPGEF